MKTTTNRKLSLCYRSAIMLAFIFVVSLASTRLRADVETVGTCGGVSVTIPFTDVSGNNIFFCAIAEAYFSGLTKGTSPTTYSPTAPVSREQMAAFITRTLDQSLRRGSRRAALRQWWTPQLINNSALTTVGNSPTAVESDGEDVWVANFGSNSVSRVRASDGKVIETWTGMFNPRALLVANGRIYVAGGDSPGKLWAIDPDKPAGNAVELAEVGGFPNGMAYDGEHILTANATSITNYHVPSGSKVTYTNNFSAPGDVLYDGDSFWVTDTTLKNVRKVLVTGQVFQDTHLSAGANRLAFDGTNIWVTGTDGLTITVIRAATGDIVATLTGNGLSNPKKPAFDGERILIPNQSGNTVSLWRATDLAPLGSFSTGADSLPIDACSDGINFWVVLLGPERLARF
jgi:S-layer family protein